MGSLVIVSNNDPWTLFDHREYDSQQSSNGGLNPCPQPDAAMMGIKVRGLMVCQKKKNAGKARKIRWNSRVGLA